MANASKDSADDFSVYSRIDGIKCSTYWRLGSYDDHGILSSNMIAELIERFQLASTIVHDLSVHLGHCLNNDNDIAINLTEVRRSTAIAEGQRLLRLLRRQTKQGNLAPRELRDALVPLSTYFAVHPEDAELLPSLKGKLEHAIEISPDIIATIKMIFKTPGAVAILSPRDKRHSRDKRRQYVIETCCFAWRDADRALTYTTYSDARADRQRAGPLIEFIQSVVAMITHPNQKLRGEAIRADIDRFRDALAHAEKDFCAPPKKPGNQYT